MTNPTLVELTRGQLVESTHTGALAIAAPDGRLRVALGNVERAIFPRSAIKAFQAIPLIETGAADRFELDAKALALACASHSGDDRHAALARAILARADLDEQHLGCGAHHAMDEALARRFAALGRQPTQLQNNCSGKHACMLATCRHCGDPTAGYLDPSHPHQQRIARALHDMCGDGFVAGRFGIDGCSAPNWAIPLRHLAGAFARFITGEGLSAQRKATCARLAKACISEPFFVAGDRRLDTTAMARTPGMVFLKTGAEGVYCGALPTLGLGFALKIDDGNKRASEALVEAILDRVLPPQSTKLGALGAQKNWLGTVTGELRVTADLQRSIEGLRAA